MRKWIRKIRRYEWREKVEVEQKNALNPQIERNCGGFFYRKSCVIFELCEVDNEIYLGWMLISCNFLFELSCQRTTSVT